MESWDGSERRRSPDLNSIIVRIATRLDNLFTNFEEYKVSTHEEIKELKTRVTTLEAMAGKIWGGVAIIVFFIDMSIKLFIK